MSLTPLAGHFSVEASARRIRHYRYVEERMMRVMGGWIALTPELPAKLVLGRHVWECAQHADLWGRRLPELRAPAHRGEPASDAVARFMDRLEEPVDRDQTVERLTGIYRVLKPHLRAVYEQHLATANAVYEPPTRRILERCIVEERRHGAAGRIVLDRLATSAPARRRSDEWTRRLTDALGAAGGVTGATGGLVVAETADAFGIDVAGDVVALDSRFDVARVEPDVTRWISARLGPLASSDFDALVPYATLDAVAVLRDAVREIGGGVSSSDVVACAKVGRFRLVKVEMRGPSGGVVVRLELRPADDGWRMVEADVTRHDLPA